MSDVSIAALAREEVLALHAFFVAWFTGAGATPDFATCERAFAADFRMITPGGEVHDRDAVVERLRRAHGTFGNDLRIDILDPRPVWAAEDAVLLEYVEQQYRDGRSTRRRSTALFVRSASAPRGVVWRHLQETWIESGESNA